MQIITGENFSIYVADVIDGLRAIASRSVHCVITSPPYWGLRDYGYDGQIGLERTPQEFVSRLVDVFREVMRVLRDDGVMFVNLGDSYATGAGSAFYAGGRCGKHNSIFDSGSIPRTQPNRMPIGLMAGNMVGSPWRFALAMQDNGWILRKDIIWSKMSPMPESVSGWQWVRCKNKISCASNHDAGKNAKSIDRRKVGFNARYKDPESHSAKFEECTGCEKCRDTDGFVLKRGSWRPTNAHEYIFMFSKSAKYFCDGETSKEPCSGGAHSRGSGLTPKTIKLEKGASRQAKPKANDSFHSSINEKVESRNLRSVWRLATESYKGAHFATYPSELVRLCLSAATSRHGCCDKCGSQYAPIVEKQRRATRPGTDSKTLRNYEAMRIGASARNPNHPNMIGNRDPKRHTTVTNIVGFLPTCECAEGGGLAKPLVLDPFGGSMTTGQVAINYGCRFIGIEANPKYAELGLARLKTPWIQKSKR